MCGFLAWVRQPHSGWSAGERDAQQAALASMVHRGPDDDSEHVEAGLWLGFRRLSILDLSQRGRQPMHFDADRYSLVFNGEIYNYRQLRGKLRSPALQSSGDTAVLGSMLATESVDQVLSQLRGMFAFVWWDRERRELVAARDPFGIKPLYYQETPDAGICLGSELRPVTQLTGPSSISRKALAQYLRWGAIQAPDTLLEGVHCLPPGCLLRWQDGEIQIERYCQLSWPDSDSWIVDPQSQQAAVRDAILDSVQAHLVSDVPVGVFLSGGLDSTMMASGMKHLGSERVKAFSIGYEQGGSIPDESDAAEQTARFLGCEFVRERVSAESLFDMLDHYFDDLDQPTGDALNSWLVSQVAARHVKVAISGLGADEWFAGYNFMRLARLAEKSSSVGRPLMGVGGQIVRAIGGVLPDSVKFQPGWKALFYAAGGAGDSVADWHAFSRTILNQTEVSRLLRSSQQDVARWTTGTPERLELVDQLDCIAPDASLHQLLMLETQTYLANTLLRDNDVTSMAHGLELRVPLVDREVFRLAGLIPANAKLNLAGGKRVLREAMSEFLPDWIREDQQKKTFTLPLMKWMRHPQWRDRIHDTLGSQACRQRDWVDPAEVARIRARYEKSGNETASGWKLSQSVWLLFVLESWAMRNRCS